MAAGRALADISATVDKLDPSDGLPMPPPDVVVADIFVALSEDDAFAGVGIRGVTTAGARLRYAYDPNTGAPLPTAPGVANRHVTFFSPPRPRDNDSRFDRRGYLHGFSGYCGPPPSPTFTPTLLDAATSTQIVPDGLSGDILRVTLDLANVEDPLFRQDSPAIVIAEERPPNSLTLFETTCPHGEPGVLISSRRNFRSEFDFGIYGIIPEPAGFWLLTLGAAMMRRRS